MGEWQYHAGLREEYSELLKGLYNSSTKGIRKSRYLIIGMEAKNLKEARFRLNEKASDVIRDFEDE